MKIRIHHLLCMQGFQDKGYNEEFVKNMTEVVNIFKNDSKTKVTIITALDSICKCCPHKQGEICVSKGEEYNKERVEKEKRIAEFLDLELNKEYEIGFLFERVNSRICNQRIAKQLYCDDCQWLYCCLWHQGLEE